MNICKNCGEKFATTYTDKNGKRVDLRKREYCTSCNPIGERRFWRGKRVDPEHRNKKKTRKCEECGKQFTYVARNLICTTCINKKNRFGRKTKAMEILGNKCEVCGYSKCLRCMDIHHLEENDKNFTFASSWGLAWKKIEKELDKCVLLCCRCHREVHEGLIDLK